MFFKRLSLRTKLLALSGVGFLPLVVVLLVTWRVGGETSRVAVEECSRLSSEDLDHVLGGAYSLCVTQQESLEQQLEVALNVAREALDHTGGMTLRPCELATWDGVNQLTGATTRLRLPRVRLGQSLVAQNFEYGT